MDETKKLELAIELAKLEALDQIRIAIARTEGRMTSGQTNKLLEEAMAKVEKFESDRKKKAAIGIRAAVADARGLQDDLD